MNSLHNQSCASTVLLFRSVFVASLLNEREDPDDQSRLYVCTVPGDMELSTTASLQHAVNEAMQADIAELREIYVDRIVPGRMPTEADYTWLAIFDGHPQVLAWGQYTLNFQPHRDSGPMARFPDPLKRKESS